MTETDQEWARRLRDSGLPLRPRVPPRRPQGGSVVPTALADPRAVCALVLLAVAAVLVAVTGAAMPWPVLAGLILVAGIAFASWFVRDQVRETPAGDPVARGLAGGALAVAWCAVMTGAVLGAVGTPSTSTAVLGWSAFAALIGSAAVAVYARRRGRGAADPAAQRIASLALATCWATIVLVILASALLMAAISQAGLS